jgi:hypothetical protein
VIELDSALHRHPVLWSLAATLVFAQLGLAMYGVRRDSPRFWGAFEILSACALFWNAIAVAIQQGTQLETGSTYRGAFFLKILVAIFLVVEGLKDYERGSPKKI